MLIVTCLVLGRWDVADWLEQPAVIKPVDPVERGEFDRLHMPPWSLLANHFCFKQTDDRFGERVVVRITAAPD